MQLSVASRGQQGMGVLLHLQQEDLLGSILREPVGQHTPSGSAAHKDVVILVWGWVVSLYQS